MEKLPTYRIRQVDFIVDVQCCILRHPLDENIFFHLLKQNRNEDGTYNITFSLKDFKATKPVKGNERQQTVVVPSMVKLDPLKMSQKFNLHPSDLPENDTLLHCNNELFQTRKAGRRPIIDIAGEGFMVDWQKRNLMPLNDPFHPGLNFHKMRSDRSHTRYFFFYDKGKQRQVDIAPTLMTIPNNIIGVEIPVIEFLDPYARAVEYGWQNQMGWFDHHPVQLHLKASIIPLEQTILPDLVRSNIARHQMKNKKGFGL
ncbi:hypothetical protein [Chitinophaga sp. OAE865]|uniref:hypothetical protein n=1 Tax=Chitinophaga sp. OAE865 TaxID=2817898 RepID=UPI001AE2B96B